MAQGRLLAAGGTRPPGGQRGAPGAGGRGLQPCGPLLALALVCLAGCGRGELERLEVRIGCGIDPFLPVRIGDELPVLGSISLTSFLHAGLRVSGVEAPDRVELHVHWSVAIPGRTLAEQDGPEELAPVPEEPGAVEHLAVVPLGIGQGWPSDGDPMVIEVTVRDADGRAGQASWQGTTNLGGWCGDTPRSGAPLNGVWGSSGDDVWAVGGQGTVHRGHWDGTAWSAVVSGTTDDLHAVWGISARDVWAAGESFTLLHWDGTSWATVLRGASGRFGGVGGSGARDVWVVGWGSTPPSSAGIIYRWNGDGWTRWAPGESPRILRGVWASGPNDVWVAGSYLSEGSILHWDGAVWSEVQRTADYLTAVWGAGPTDVWALGALGQVHHWDGAVWSHGSRTGDILESVWGTGPDDVWVVGSPVTQAATRSSNVLHWDGTAWSNAKIGAEVPGFSGVWGSGPDDVWAVGSSLFHWNGDRWSGVDHP